MARLLVDDDDLVVRPAWWERVAVRRGDVRVALRAVRRVTLEGHWWRALRGVQRRGVCVPGVLCLGTREHQGGQDFVAVRPSRPVVCVELSPSAPSRLLAVAARDGRDGEAMVRRLRRAVPDTDASTPCRQPLPVPVERPLPVPGTAGGTAVGMPSPEPGIRSEISGAAQPR